MSKNTGGPAFPGKDEWDVQHGGMTLRDYFAVYAMQGLIGGRWRPDRHGQAAEAYSADAYAWATQAYKFADAMLEARK